VCSSISNRYLKLTHRDARFGERLLSTSCFGRKSPDELHSWSNAETRRHRSTAADLEFRLGPVPLARPVPPLNLRCGPNRQRVLAPVLSDPMDEDMSPSRNVRDENSSGDRASSVGWRAAACVCDCGVGRRGFVVEVDRYAIARYALPSYSMGLILEARGVPSDALLAHQLPSFFIPLGFVGSFPLGNWSATQEGMEVHDSYDEDKIRVKHRGWI
jgi:hypothetical protein